MHGAKLSSHEIELLLQRGLTARMACCDLDGWPYVVPVWFEWDGNRFWIVGAEKAQWADYIQNDGRVAIGVDDPETSERLVCQGKVTSMDAPATGGDWVALAASMARRYLGEDAVAYIAATHGVRRWLVSVEPVRMTSWRGPSRAD